MIDPDIHRPHNLSPRSSRESSNQEKSVSPVAQVDDFLSSQEKSEFSLP